MDFQHILKLTKIASHLTTPQDKIKICREWPKTTDANI
jgi:hypothetical protein